MEPKSMNQCSSTLHEAPIVQELAKQKLSSVPYRYVRHDERPLLPYSLNYPLPKTPIVNFQKLLDGSSAEFELQVLHNACQEWGFFQLINHGVNPTIINKMKSGAIEFYNLPMEKKMNFGQEPGEMQGYGQAFVVSEESKLDWVDRFHIITSPPHLRKPHLIPNLPCALRDAIESYSSEMKILGAKILKQMAKVLKMKDEDMEILSEEEAMQSMRMNYYPPCPQPELVTGFRPHSDANALTILLQANEIDGLQVKKDGNWIPVTPLPNAFIVNIGDILEILTNGSYTSVEHRVATNPEKIRLSVVTFFNPRPNGELGPAPSLISHDNPARFSRIPATEYFRLLYSKEFMGKRLLDNVRI